METNRIINGDSAQVLSEFPDECVDCVVTSPPYDSLRTYGRDTFNFPFEEIARQLTRVLKPGGVIVWVVGVETKNGGETLAPQKQSIFFVEKCGLLLHDTMIYEKNSAAFPARPNSNRYTQVWEYMFVFSKGKPKTSRLIIDKKNRWVGWKGFGKTTQRTKEGELIEYEKKEGTPEVSPRYNVWRYATGKGFTSSIVTASEHPALFPEALVYDHLRTWTDAGDVVLDPFNGAGTTTAVARNMNRKYIGIDISQSYCELARKRTELKVDLVKLEALSRRINNQRYPQDVQRYKGK